MALNRGNQPYSNTIVPSESGKQVISSSSVLHGDTDLASFLNSLGGGNKIVASTDDMTKEGLLYWLPVYNAENSEQIDYYEIYHLVGGVPAKIGIHTDNVSGFLSKEKLGKVTSNANMACVKADENGNLYADTTMVKTQAKDGDTVTVTQKPDGSGVIIQSSSQEQGVEILNGTNGKDGVDGTSFSASLEEEVVNGKSEVYLKVWKNGDEASTVRSSNLAAVKQIYCTQAEYDALTTKRTDVDYNIYEE